MGSKSQEFYPYKGLQPYEEADQKYFFGRERDIDIITSNLCATPLTVLYGASGVGKSSVLQAGVTPRLHNETGYALIVFRDWQDGNFLDALKRKTLAAITRKDPQAARDIDISLPLEKFLRKCARASQCRLLIIFDQFEEYFLYHGRPVNGGGNDFDSQFAKAVNRADLQANFLLSLRDDGLSKLDRFQARIPNLLGNLLRLEHLDNESAQSAICEPLQRYNQDYRVDPPATISGGERYVSGDLQNPSGLVARLLEDLKPGKVKFGEAGVGELDGRAAAGIETPFLQMVLMRLWDERDRTKNCLDEETYDRLGGAQNIVRTHLDNVMRDKFVDDEKRDIAARLFQYLVTPENEKIALSQNVLAEWINEPAERIEPVINLLSASDVRILRPVNVMLGQRAPQRYEIFHDVLAPAILAWRTRFRVDRKAKEEAERRIEQERLAAEEREAEQQWQLKIARDRAEAERQRAEHQRELAAAEARERQAQAEQAETERLRAKEHERTSKRLAVRSKALAVMVTISIIASLLAVLMWRRAVASEGRAIAGLVRAEESALIARANQERARDYAIESEQLRDEGKAAKATAKQMELLAEERLKQANRAKEIAAAAQSQAKKDRASAEAASARAGDLQWEATVLRLDALKSREDAARNNEKAQQNLEKAEQARNLNFIYQNALKTYRAKDYPGAIELLTKALPLIEDGSTDKADALTIIGNSYSDLGKETEAAASYIKALEIYRAKNDLFGEASTLNNLGVAYGSMEGETNRQEAIRYYESAIATYDKVGVPDIKAPALIALADTYVTSPGFDPPADQDVQKAEALYRQAIGIYKLQRNTEKAVVTLTKIAELYEDSDEPAKRTKAYEAYAEGAAMYEQAQQYREAAKALSDLALLQRRQDNAALAQENFEKAAKVYERGGDFSGAARTLRSAASINNCQNCDNTKKRKAAEFYRQAVALYKQMKTLSAVDLRGLTASLKSLATIYKALGDKKLADEYEDELKALEDDPE